MKEEAKQDYTGLKDIKHLYGREKETTNDGIEDMQYLFNGHDMRLIEDGRRVKTWLLTGTLNQNLTDTIMHKTTPDIDMRTKVVYSFECEIHQGGGEVGKYYKTKSSTRTLTSIWEMQDFIDQCEIKRLDLEDNEFWGKAYLPPERTIETPGLYKGKVVFLHMKVKFISTNEPLLRCGPLLDWLRKKRCLYVVDGKEERTDNLCVLRCLAVYMRRKRPRGTEFLTKEALKLAKEYYSNNKRKDARATKLVNFEGIAEKFNVNIRVYKTKVNSEKTPWRMVYG